MTFASWRGRECQLVPIKPMAATPTERDWIVVEPEPELELEPEPEPEPPVVGFAAAGTFEGVREGCVFKRGQYGLGYYSDDAAETEQRQQQRERAVDPTPLSLRPAKKKMFEGDGSAATAQGQLVGSAVAQQQQVGKGKRAHEIVPMVSPFPGTYYALQQWSNSASVRALAPS